MILKEKITGLLICLYDQNSCWGRDKRPVKFPSFKETLVLFLIDNYSVSYPF